MEENKDGAKFSDKHSPEVREVRKYLSGADLTDYQGTEGAKELLKALMAQDQFSYARRFLNKLLDSNTDNQLDAEEIKALRKKQAHCISKDLNLGVNQRTDEAIKAINKAFDNPGVIPPKFDNRPRGHDEFTQDAFGVAGGIYKRKWLYTGQLEDLIASFNCYHEGAKGSTEGRDKADSKWDVKQDGGYTAINLAFMHDLLESRGHGKKDGQKTAREIREEILKSVPACLEDPDKAGNRRWILLTLAEAALGLKRYPKALDWTRQAVSEGADSWEEETTARQWVQLIEIWAELSRLEAENEEEALGIEEIIDAEEEHPENRAGEAGPTEETVTPKDVLQTLLGSEEDALKSVLIGKVGLALSGGGFRASFYHLGMLARLAELDMLRHVDVLSCVSGGSILGAAYYVALRKRLEVLNDDEVTQQIYCDVVAEVIEKFTAAVQMDLRCKMGVSLKRMVWKHGLIRTEKGAKLFETHIYRTIWDDRYVHPDDLNQSESGQGMEQRISSSAPQGTIWMHDLNFSPAGFRDQIESEQGDKAKKINFNPKRHNWRRKNNVPALVLNATTLNTGHSWQFTTTWMGEWPYDLLEDVNSTPLITQAWYDPEKNVRVTLGNAVAASAAVPGLFAPVTIKGIYNDSTNSEKIRRFDVRLVDGGAYDNHGTVNLLAQDCNLILLSDAAGQLPLDNHPFGNAWSKPFTPPFKLLPYGQRIMTLFMERIRQTSIAELKAKADTGLLRGLLYIHMKKGLSPSKLELCDYEEPNEDLKTNAKHAASGIRLDFLDAISNVRTDLNRFKDEEAEALMACGYMMTRHELAKNFATKKNQALMSKNLMGPDISAEQDWKFTDAIDIISQSHGALTNEGKRWLKLLRKGQKLPIRGVLFLLSKIVFTLLAVVLIIALAGYIALYSVAGDDLIQWLERVRALILRTRG